MKKRIEVINGKKCCVKCNITKEESLFRITNSKSKSRGNICSECVNSYMREMRLLNKEKYKDYALKSYYGIGIEEYNQLFIEQKGCCAICNKHQSEFTKSFAIDHCHSTGKIRQLLCIRCNTALGAVGDSVDVLIKMIQYIERWNINESRFNRMNNPNAKRNEARKYKERKRESKNNEEKDQF